MIRSAALGLIAGAIVVIAMAWVRPPPPIAVTFGTDDLTTTPATTRSSAPPSPTDVAVAVETQVGTLTLQTRIYRIDDLMISLSKRTELLTKTISPGRSTEAASSVEIVDALIKLIEDTVDTDAWRDNGGMLGSIRELGGLLIVTHTPAAHAQLRALLDQLRQAAAPLPATRPTGGS